VSTPTRLFGRCGVPGQYRGEDGAAEYADEPGFCKAARLEEIRGHDHVLTPGGYVGAAAVEDDGTPFPGRFAELTEKLDEQFAQGEALSALIHAKLRGIHVP
jgi:type I restriction enzyme M protein